MADISYLERMGRELKCPICLSLINCAVSLTCNHVFCNSCIMKSMKSGSNCPVCKVPYQRREVRPVPHMDNLVSIYKSMEVASGVSIFVTQNAPATKLSDEGKLAEGDQNHGAQETSNTCQNRSKNQGRSTAKRSRRISNSSVQKSGSEPVNPSFPNKKRVQVPQQYPLPETPTQPTKFPREMGEYIGDEPKNSLITPTEKASVNEKGGPTFPPFFWLREDVENSTQQTDDNHFTDTPPVAPSFSDLKDSDDEKGEARGGSHDAEFFDSEMFEWTQRPCSPELCSTPIKIQVNDLGAASLVWSTSEEPISSNTYCEKPVLADARLQNLDKIQNGKTQNCSMSKKRVKNANERANTKQNRLNTYRILGRSVDPKKGSKIQKCKDKSKEDAKRTKTGVEKCSDKDPNLKTGKSNNETKPQNQTDSSLKSKNKRHRSTKNNALEEVNVTDCPKHQEISQFSTDQNKKSSVLAGQLTRCHREIKSATIRTPFRELRNSKKLKVSFDNITENRLADATHCIAAAKDTQPVKNVQAEPAIKVQSDSSATDKVLQMTTGAHLRKCHTTTNKLQCAFCHSAEDSEASGDMVHYLNGKPVAADESGGFNIIHSHRNCTEWAPNVYFEDDTVKNLKAELARSRRITCSCCGIKGAALGCYEKNCRKSFHVPCAKLMPESRWDFENFVMLCPLHASSKLPGEFPGSLGKKRRQSIPKEQSQRQQEQVSVKPETSPSWHWNSRGSPDKIKLCCSALTVAEKEIVSQFERISGVTELKKWSSCVTHVIASTDENGACRRTLKILTGILEGKWILSVDWIKACINAMEPVDEEQYEISIDVHGIQNGPQLGRLRLINKEPKLFNKFKFYFAGEFVPSYKGYLQDLVIAAGGTVLHRKPISGDKEAVLSGSSMPSTFVIYSLELPDKCYPSKKNRILNCRRSNAETVADSTGAKVASSSWIMNSIAACKLQSVDE